MATAVEPSESETARPGVTRWVGFAGRSLVARLVLLVLAFLAVPSFLYAEFRSAEET